MSNTVQILNYNHNVISLSNGNTIIITDNVKGNSISIPQPVTSILQINSPGPQGPAGVSGSSVDTGSLLTTASFNSYTSSVTSQFAGTASYATTASYAMNGGGTTINTSSFVTTSSFNSYTQSINTATSSFVTNSQTSSFVKNSQTSSMSVNTALTSSYPITVTGSTLRSTNPEGGVNGNIIHSIYLGSGSGFNASGSYNSIFLGQNSGYNALDAHNSHFIGYYAGVNSSAIHSNFIGEYAGAGGNAHYSNFLGRNAGNGSSAYQSNFIGANVGQSTQAYNSNFIGYETGNSATNANNSNFIGYSAGVTAYYASYSTLIGTNVGKGFTGNQIGANNIIIGTNITLPNGYTNRLNIGGVLYGSNLYYDADVNNNPTTIPAGGKIGINQPDPTFNFEVSGSVGFKNLTNSAQANVVGIDVATGKLYYQGPGEFASGSFATTGSNTFNGNQSISGSLTISGSLNVSGSISTNYVYVDTYDSQSYFLINNPACVYRFSNTTGQSIDIYLPNASTCPGRIYYISRPSESGGLLQKEIPFYNGAILIKILLNVLLKETPRASCSGQRLRGLH
jgi:fibronectin-binding autotransporter adhesin